MLRICRCSDHFDFQGRQRKRHWHDSFTYKGDGTLTWHGYGFGTPVKTIIRTAGDGQEGVAMDGLQATVESNSPFLYNISTRGLVQTGKDVLIGGLTWITRPASLAISPLAALSRRAATS
ncbi:MAG: hypothetical protein DME43_12675 [Verrucomicrobia bacterium]|nr:MAG: hypothetical protein DME43_12675 [Verrucomicrobiota bacterium]